MVADEAPPAWAPRLPDLKTRLAVTPVTRIEHPDDRLFAALIQLFFADRGLHIPADALRFMAERLHRDYWTAERAVEAVDRFAIAERARLSPADDPPGADRSADDRRSGLAAVIAVDPVVGGRGARSRGSALNSIVIISAGRRPAQHGAPRSRA